MADDMVELIPVNEQDEAIYAGWETGKGLRTLAREFGLSVMRVEQALDRCLPVFDGATQFRAFKRELRRLEDLSSEFYTIAKRDHCRDSAHLVARLNERICAMRGWSPVNIRMDPYMAETAEGPSGFDRIYQMILRIGKDNGQPDAELGAAGPDLSDGNGSPPER